MGRFTCHRWLKLGVTGLVALGLAGCGGSGGKAVGAEREAGKLSGDPPGIVARVGGSVISGATFARSLAAEQKGEVPLVPPQFTACVAHLKKRAAAVHAAGLPTLSDAELRKECGTRRQQLREEVLDRLISSDWVIGGARELGVDVGGQAVAADLASLKRGRFPTPARFQAFLASTGQTVGDLLFAERVQLDNEAIRAAIAGKVHPPTQARVAQYYEHHKKQYLVPETRDLEIVGTLTQAQAQAVRREIASGKSFASVAKAQTATQPFHSKDGVVLGLVSGLYKEPSLNNAIFTARPGVLSGVIKTVIGYYVFKLMRIHPAYQETLARVASQIRQDLPLELQREALVEFIKAWRAKWTARTDCSPGYVVRRCRQSKAAPTAEDPYTLN
jgi:parvulin-like peptidyl-prolyl isomerase